MQLRLFFLFLLSTTFCQVAYTQAHIKIKLIEKAIVKEAKIIQLWNKNTGETHLEFLDSLGVANFQNINADVDE